MSTVSTVAVMLYGVFTMVGGVIGYVKAKSAASLMAGLGCGIALIVCALGMQRGSLASALASLGIAVLLGTRFFMTWRQRRRLMPDLIMVLFSMATVCLVTLSLAIGR